MRPSYRPRIPASPSGAPQITQRSPATLARPRARWRRREPCADQASGGLATDDERDVMPTEPHGVREREVDLRLSRAIGYVVEVALRIASLLIDRRRKQSIPHPEDAERGFDRACRAQSVPGHRFRR